MMETMPDPIGLEAADETGGADIPDAIGRAKLARMANQIAIFFERYPEEYAVVAITDHINQFWSRTMRAQLLVGFQPKDPDLHPLVARAFDRILPPGDRLP